MTGTLQEYQPEVQHAVSSVDTSGVGDSSSADNKSPSSVLHLISQSGPHMVSFQALIEASSMSDTSPSYTQGSAIASTSQQPSIQAQKSLQPLRELSKEDTMGVLAFPGDNEEPRRVQDETLHARDAITPSPEWTRREEELYQ